MIWEVFNGIVVDGIGVNFLSFAFLCRVCVLLVFLHFFFFCFCFLPFFLFPLTFVLLVFLHCFLFFFVSLFLFIRLKRFVFSAHFQAVAVDCPSVFGYGETAKTREKKGISLRPRLHQLRQKLSERCSFFKTQTQ